MSLDRYAVFGHPVAHSLSPRIHSWFAEQTGERIDYRAFEAPLDDFAGTLRDFFASGGRGANVTVPFKGEASMLADERDARVERSGAANTLRRDADGRIRAFNTDGIGLLRDLVHNLGVDLAGRSVVLLGAGGAAAGVIEPLLEAGPACLIIGNRTPRRAQELARRFADLGPVAAEALADLPAADVIINATAASLDGGLPELAPGVVKSQTFAYDMVYAARPTPFLARCRELGAARTADGLGMLVEQAAEAFLIWRGVRPDTGGVLTRLRASVAEV